MKKKYLLLLLVLAQLAITTRSSAISAAAGGEIMYRYVNDSTYRFFVKIYHPCSSNFPEQSELSLCYRNTTCGAIWATKRIFKAYNTPDGKPNGQMMDLGCGNQASICTDPNSTHEMYREWWYSGEVSVAACNKWIFSVNYNERDRNPASNLVIMPWTDNNLYIEATINNLAAKKQSSPYFSVPPPLYTCSGSLFFYNNGVIDPDGDSLVYKIIQPRSATWDFTVVCSGFPPLDLPFSKAQYNLTNNPFETNNTFALNATTGDISFTPSGVQVAYVSYLVEKYRNGVLIGTVMRDSRLEVKDCSTPPVQMTLNKGTITGGTVSKDTLYVCSNSEVNFCFNATTSTPGAILSVKDNSRIALKGAKVTYENQGTGNVAGCVRWTPKPDDLGFRYFVVSVKDSSCTATSAPVVQTYKIPVMVKAGVGALAKDTIVCPGASVSLSAYGGTQFNWSSIPANSHFSCTSCDKTEASPQSDITQYIVSSNINNGCPTKDTVVVYLDHSTNIKVDPDTIVLCDGGAYVQLGSQAGGAKPLKTIACGAYSPSSKVGLTDVSAAQNSNNSNSSNVLYTNQDAGYWGPFDQTYQTQRMQIIYRKDELIHDGMKPGTIQKIAFNFGEFKLDPAKNNPPVNPTFQNFRIALRCTDKFEFVAPYQKEFETGLSEAFFAPSVTVHPGWNEFEFTIPYDYDTTKNLIVQVCFNGVSPQAIIWKDYKLPLYYVTTSYRSSIQAAQSALGDACAGNLGIVHTFDRRPDIRFSISELPETDFKYSWSPSTGMDNPGAPATGVFPDKTTWYTVSTKGRFGCEVKDSVLVYVAEKDFSIDPKESVVCEGEVVRINGHGGYRYAWYRDDYTEPSEFSCLVCDSADVTGLLGMHNYKVVISDFYGCADTLDASVLGKPRPATNIVNNDTTISYGQSVQLRAEGAAYYIWSPGQTLNNYVIPSPIATPSKSTLYIVSGYDTSGCVVEDSVWVRVIMSEDVFIPNAFSPNGDGINDVFKIGNVIFQKVAAFSIFNRWGKEVYRAPTGQNGWDGTYNGQPATMDTYQYYIQLVLHDGQLKTYKGDVILVR